MALNVESTCLYNMPDDIKVILSKFRDVFLVDLPVGCLVVRLGHEYKSDLEGDTPRVPRPVYS